MAVDALSIAVQTNVNAQLLRDYEAQLARDEARTAALEARGARLAAVRARAEAAGFGVPGDVGGLDPSSRRLANRIGRPVARLGASLVIGQIITASGIGEGEGFSGVLQRTGTNVAAGLAFGGPAGALMALVGSAVSELTSGFQRQAEAIASLKKEQIDFRNKLAEQRAEFVERLRQEEARRREEIFDALMKSKEEAKEERYQSLRAFSEGVVLSS